MVTVIHALDPNKHMQLPEQTKSSAGDFSEDSDSDSKQSAELLSFKHYHFKSAASFDAGSIPAERPESFFRSFPNNVYFKQEDFLHNTHYGDCYDTITWWTHRVAFIGSFSVSKWVHLNWGDDGLLYMLLKMYSLLKEHGRIIIEYQSWSSYRKKRAYCSEIAAVYPTLRLRPEAIPTILERLGMQLISNRKPTSNVNIPSHITKGFNRNIAVLRRVGDALPLDFREVTVTNLREKYDVKSLIEGLEEAWHVCCRKQNNSSNSSSWDWPQDRPAKQASLRHSSSRRKRRQRISSPQCCRKVR